MFFFAGNTEVLCVAHVLEHDIAFLAYFPNLSEIMPNMFQHYIKIIPSLAT